MRAALLRAGSSCPATVLSRQAALRSSTRIPAVSCAFATSQQPRQQQHSRQAHAISNPTLADIEKRWEAMPPQEQADLWMQLRDRMKAPWNEMTLQEKRAAYWVAFGPHGPRALPPPGEGLQVFTYTMAGVAVAVALFYTTRYFARPPPSTMNKEWQEKTNEMLKAQNADPISGISSEGYTGKGMVQSKPKKA